TLLDCSDEVISSGDEEITISATMGETYYFRVYLFSSAEGAIFDIVASGDPLSIDMGKISAENIGKSNKVTWNSIKESIGDLYVLERSRDGKTFHTIADFKAIGQANTYEHIDNTPFVGANYYRVRLVNNDGSSSYTNIVVAHMNSLGNSISV